MSADKMQDGALHITWPANRVAQLTLDHDAAGRISVRFTVEPEAKADNSAEAANPATVSPESPVATPAYGTLIEQQRPSYGDLSQ